MGVRLSVPLINRSTPARGWFAAERGLVRARHRFCRMAPEFQQP